MNRTLPLTSLSILVCLGTLGPVSASAAVRVVTTTTDLGALVRVVGGDRVQVDTICAGQQDPHYVRARPSYMVKLSRADLLVAVGLELEIGWLPSLIQGARNPEINPGQRGYLDASSAITPIGVPTGPIDRSQGDVHPLGNPHYWLDPANVTPVARLIAARLSALDPDGAKDYQARLKSFEERMEKATQRWSAAMAPYAGTEVVSYHRTFNYFLKRFGLTALGYIEERPGIPPAAAHVARLIQRMRARKVRVIFHEIYFNRATSDLVSSRSDAEVLLLPTSVGGADGVETYEQLIDRIVNAFVTAMQESGHQG